MSLSQRVKVKLLVTSKHLSALGNTVIVVVHDEDTIGSADHSVDIGPGAGIHGCEVVFNGKPS